MCGVGDLSDIQPLASILDKFTSYSDIDDCCRNRAGGLTSGKGILSGLTSRPQPWQPAGYPAPLLASIPNYTKVLVKGIKDTMPPKTRSDEDYTTLTQVNELLQMQQEVFTALLQQQQDNFKSFVHVIMDSTNARFDSLTKEQQDIKTSLQFTQKDVDELKADAQKQKKEEELWEQKMITVNESLFLFAAKMNYLEGQSKRNNLLIPVLVEEK